jgi:hypothetical protein
VIHDRDPLYTTGWKALLASRGVKSVPTPAKSPNCNAVAERFIRTVREECLDHFVIMGERHLRYLLKNSSRTTTESAITRDSTARSSGRWRASRTITPGVG